MRLFLTFQRPRTRQRMHCLNLYSFSNGMRRLHQGLLHLREFSFERRACPRISQRSATDGDSTHMSSRFSCIDLGVLRVCYHRFWLFDLVLKVWARVHDTDPLALVLPVLGPTNFAKLPARVRLHGTLTARCTTGTRRRARRSWGLGVPTELEARWDT